MTNIIINQNGLQQIHDALGKYHKLGYDHFTPEMLSAWAADVEDNYSNCGNAEFEIRSHDTKAGSPVIIAINPDGYDTVNYDD